MENRHGPDLSPFALNADTADLCAAKIRAHLVAGRLDAAVDIVLDARADAVAQANIETQVKRIAVRDLAELPIAERLGKGGFDVRLTNALEDAGILTAAQLCERFSEVTDLPNCGPKAVQRLEEVFKRELALWRGNIERTAGP